MKNSYFAENRFVFFEGAAEQPKPKGEAPKDNLQDQIDKLMEQGKFKEAKELIAEQEKEETLEEKEAELKTQLNGFLRQEKYEEAKKIIKELEVIKILKQLEAIRGGQNINLNEVLQDASDEIVLRSLEYAVNKRIKKVFPAIIDALHNNVITGVVTRAERSEARLLIGKINEGDITDEKTKKQVQGLGILLYDI